MYITVLFIVLPLIPYLDLLGVGRCRSLMNQKNAKALKVGQRHSKVGCV